MLSYIWPIALVVLSNTLYQVCAKTVPDGMNPLASLTVTYLVGAVVSCVMYFILNRNANLPGHPGSNHPAGGASGVWLLLYLKRVL